MSRGCEGAESAEGAEVFEPQKTFILKQGNDGMPMAGGLPEGRHQPGDLNFNRKKKYGGLMPSEMRRLKQLDEENRRLKSLVDDLSLDKEILQDAIRRKT